MQAAGLAVLQDCKEQASHNRKRLTASWRISLGTCGFASQSPPTGSGLPLIAPSRSLSLPGKAPCCRSPVSRRWYSFCRRCVSVRFTVSIDCRSREMLRTAPSSVCFLIFTLRACKTTQPDQLLNAAQFHAHTPSTSIYICKQWRLYSLKWGSARGQAV